MNMNPSEYASRDLYESSFQIVSNNKLIRLEKVGKHFLFVFSPKEKCEQVRDMFWSGKGTASPLEYANAVKNLKEQIFNHPLRTPPPITSSNYRGQ